MALGLDGDALDRAAAMQEATIGFRRLKAHKQLPVLRAALEAHQIKTQTLASLLAKPAPLSINFGSNRFAKFNKQRDILQLLHYNSYQAS